jgi:hypothetical protein
VTLPTAVKVPAVALLIGAGSGAAALLAPVAAAPIVVAAAYTALRMARQRVWLQDTVLCRQRAFTVKRIDLAHAHVWSTYVAAGSRPTTLKAHDPIQRRRMSLPLLTVGGRPLPPEQIKAIHDAVVAGQRFRRGKTAARATELAQMILNHLA